MWHFEFMRHAFMASGCVAVLCGFVGWFLVLRGQSFAGHALSHIGFAGATGALLIGLSPLVGMVLATIGAGLMMGWEAEGDSKALAAAYGQRDSLIGLVLAASLGVGLLFLQWQPTPVSRATTLLFGNLLGIDTATLHGLYILSALCLFGLACIARPLLFSSLDPEVAAAKGVRLRGLSCAFMCLVGLATSVCSETTGILLVFSLLIGPAASLLRFGLAPWAGLLGSAALALILSWTGLVLAWTTGAPVSFWISLGGVCAYVVARTLTRKAT